MILMYHHVVPDALPPPNHADKGEWFFVHSPEGLSQHIEYLRKKRYKIISLSELINHIAKTGRAPKKCATLTFDDGWVDNYFYALPVLQAHGVNACFFIDTAHLSPENLSENKMSVVQLRAMLGSGMEIGSHTKNHPSLVQANLGDATNEIYGSKTDLEFHLGVKIDYFAYPGGAYNKKITDIVINAGYRAAVMSIGPGENSSENLFWLYRTIISEGMSTWRDQFLFYPLASSLMEMRSRRRALSRLV
jgi:peptidoglycan/xylan/chitin deacetylase (PgdA/CDA1 family)